MILIYLCFLRWLLALVSLSLSLFPSLFSSCFGIPTFPWNLFGFVFFPFFRLLTRQQRAAVFVARRERECVGSLFFFCFQYWGRGAGTSSGWPEWMAREVDEASLGAEGVSVSGVDNQPDWFSLDELSGFPCTRMMMAWRCVKCMFSPALTPCHGPRQTGKHRATTDIASQYR